MICPISLFAHICTLFGFYYALTMPTTYQASIIVTPPQSFSDVLKRTSEVLLEAEVPMILWGENALIQYGIPTAVIVSL
jgi:hypothetical protein